ncbi:hypothetical protein PILCRDRAFT_642853 [Piloderma croceum F 1598]|uniref:Uncharacterized protein n=1 Tax=Piloderma croceum (strain F 1598) TaxID=765440 RepID=A0A0C3BH22_PILCF|nr:hypothetical protein PILCRDRAFT_642853 [Piloderma croceum F 1598]
MSSFGSSQQPFADVSYQIAFRDLFQVKDKTIILKTLFCTSPLTFQHHKIMTEALIRFRKGQPLDRETFAFGSTVLFTFTANSGKQQECEIAVDIYWFVASEGTWYIKFSIPDDVKLFPGFHENSFVSHEQQTWHVDHGRHMLDEFERVKYESDSD